MILTHWAYKWGIPIEAVLELQATLGALDHELPQVAGRSEAAVQSRVRLEASSKGLRLWRNNVGAFTSPEGHHVRYGLANDSMRVNKQLKSADLVGIRPIVIEAKHVGMLFGQFTARETKAADWQYTGTPRERAQLAFLELVLSMGGDAAFANKEGTL